MNKTYTDDELKTAVSQSFTWRNVYLLLGVPHNSKYVRDHAKSIGLDLSHFTRKQTQSNVPTKRYNPFKQSLEEILVENSTYTNATNIKNRLVKEGYIDYFCSICKIDKWLNEPIVLQIDHINGKHNDNRLSNLRLLCPNCHTQTDTYAGRNNLGKKRGEYVHNFCECGKAIRIESTRCMECFHAYRKNLLTTQQD